MKLFKHGDFQKSSYCGSGNCCVRVAMKDGMVAVRDSREVQVQFSEEEWQAFIMAVKAGQFDIKK
jgi:hypothetical protein